MTITYELSRDPELLAQYYSLREACFRNELKLQGYDGSEDHHDREGLLLIARRRNRVLGGARIGPCELTPEQLGEREFTPARSCSWGRLVLAPEARSQQFARDFCAALIDMSSCLGYRHAVMISSLRNARFYRLCHSALGVEFEIKRPAPEYATGVFAGLEHYLSLSQLPTRMTPARASF